MIGGGTTGVPGGGDPRGKLITLILFSVAVAVHSVLFLGIDAVLLLAGQLLGGVSTIRFLRQSVGFLLLLLMFLVVSVIVPIWGNWNLQVVVGSVGQPATHMARLFLLYAAGALFIQTTSIHQIRDGVTWFLTPLPMRWGQKVGTTMGMTLSMFHLMRREYDRIMDAWRCRGGRSIRNPVRGLLHPLLALFTSLLIWSEHTADAMDSRGWGLNSEDPGFIARISRHPLHRAWGRKESLQFFPAWGYLLVSIYLPGL